MKKCKIYSTKRKTEAEAVIIDSHVFLTAPLRNDIEPAHIVDGQCYYPPLYAAAFAEGMNFDLMPFSTECKWGEYNNGEESKVRGWYDWYSSIDDYGVKCGYCDTKTGKIRIPPEMGYCADFNAYGAAIFGNECIHYRKERYSDYDVTDEIIEEWNRIRDGVYSGLIDTTGEVISCRGYVGIEESHHGVFFVYQTADGWGVANSEGDELIEPLGDSLTWDGIGGFTREDINKDGSKTYSIINSVYYLNSRWRVTEGLTCEPTTVYDFPPDKRRRNESLDEHFHRERFRLTQRDDKYGLVRDVLENPNEPLETYSEEILEPIFDYGDIPEAAYNAWVDMEIHYYARLIAHTPDNVPFGWDDVPEDIRENVRVYMMAKDWEQGCFYE